AGGNDIVAATPFTSRPLRPRNDKKPPATPPTFRIRRKSQTSSRTSAEIGNDDRREGPVLAALRVSNSAREISFQPPLSKRFCVRGERRSPLSSTVVA